LLLFDSNNIKKLNEQLLPRVAKEVMMAGGQKINDHGSWIGKGSKGSVFPMGVKLKSESSAEGAGAEMDYEDTTEAIKRQQTMGEKKAKSHPLKPSFRN
jgi:hypothetical protein